MRETIEGPKQNSSSDSVSLRDLVAPLFRRWILLVVVFATVFVLTLTILLLRGKQYQSHMEVLVNHERMDPLVTSEATTHNGTQTAPVTEEEINSEAELLRSQDVLEKVAIANGLQNRHLPGLLGWSSRHTSDAGRLQEAVIRLGKDLKIKTVPKSNILDVSYSSNDPKLTFGVLNTLATLYIDKHVLLHSAPGSYAFFAAETERYESAMKNVEAQLREFAREGHVAAPDLEREGIAQQVSESVGQLYAAKVAVAADESRIEKDNQRLRATSERTETSKSTSPPNMLLQQLGGELVKAQTKRSELASLYQPSYPLVVEADNEVKIAKDAFDKAQQTTYLTQTTDRDPTYEFLLQDLAKTEADLAAQRGSLTATRLSIDSMQAQIIDLNEASLQESNLQREMKADEDNYLLYLGKREQERASDALDKIRIANVAIAVPPSVPAIPTADSVPPLLIAFGAAFILSLAITYLAAYFDPSFQGPEEVADRLGVPFVVVISRQVA